MRAQMPSTSKNVRRGCEPHNNAPGIRQTVQTPPPFRLSYRHTPPNVARGSSKSSGSWFSLSLDCLGVPNPIRGGGGSERYSVILSLFALVAYSLQITYSSWTSSIPIPGRSQQLSSHSNMSQSNFRPPQIYFPSLPSFHTMLTGNTFSG